MDILVTATISGKPHGLQFHSAKVLQNLYSQCELHLELGFGEAEAEKVFNNAISNWFGEELVLTVHDRVDQKINKKYSGIVRHLFLTSGSLSVVAVSRDYTMKLLEKHRSFTDVEVHNVVNQIIQNNSIDASITGPPKSIHFRFLHQYDETDHKFLKRLARYDGCVFYHDGDKFNYDYQLNGTDDVKLGLENVSDVGMSCFLGDTKFHGVPYDYLKHSESNDIIVDSGKFSLPSHPFLSKIYKKSDDLIKEPTEIYKEPICEKGEFEQFIKNQQAFYGGMHLMVNGQTNHPMVCIGRAIECPEHPILKNTFVVTKFEAEFKGNVYNAKFDAVVKGAVARSLKTDEREYMGLLQPAIVMDSKDPNNLGRVQIRYLWDVEGNAHAWARVLTYGAGSNHGSHFTPRISDQVLVGCEHGNPSLPIVLGALYHSENKPDFKTDNGTEEVLLAKTPAGSEIRIVDKKDSEYILISTPNEKNILRMEMKGPKITLESSGGTIEVHSKIIEITADDKIQMKAGDIEITADKKIQMQANDIEIKAGNKLSLAGSSSAELKSSMSVKVEGTQVESSAAATNVIKGAMVQIN